MTTDADRAARERLAQEARATATTLLDWVGARVEAPRGEPGERPRQSPGPCTWCPVCALVAALRGEQPELTATLAEQASGLLVLLRLLLQAHATGSHDHHAPPPAPDTPSTRTTPTTPTPPTAPAGWPAEWGTPSWAADVPWDVAPHATFDPAPAARGTDDEAPAATPADRPTGRRGPRPSPRRAPGAPAAEPEATASVVGNGTGPAAHATARRGVQRIPVRRRPRPC
ncbi:hypothetical protein [Actinomycetospora soli]|uniref:hypothetical protein n=1 Tax=Actinomycetospora soli TaxID=2893887 RepID=UPI001E3AEB19|nr:hypothetical protein [Actinomycetospora soli]MCD2190123.1 hypothetical protein [Actinomycetospora soli]